MTLQDEPLFQAARPVLESLINAGYEAYYVGGSVRDVLLHKPISDVDIATSATPEEVKRLFKKTVDVGIEHGTVMVLYHGEGYEVTTFRTEEGYEDFRHPDKVTFVRNLEEDLKRRDFTINALALGIDGEVTDYFDGVGDLSRGVIRCVGDPVERFNEDALRMFRAVRFVGQLGFDVDEATVAAIATLRENLQHVAVERIRVEWEKMMTSPHRNQALPLFVETGLYEMCPHLAGMADALRELARTPHESLTVTQAWILLAQAAQLTPDDLRQLLRAWKNSNELTRQVLTGYEMLTLRQTQAWDNHMAYRCDDSLALAVEQLLPDPQLIQLQEVYQRLPIRSLKDIVVNGNDITRLLHLEQKGPIIGKVLKDLEEQLLQETLTNTHDALEAYIQWNYL